MARTNFHDEVYKDPNYATLMLEVGDVYRTKGLLVTAWELAQTYWLAHKGVPEEKWPNDLAVLEKHKFARRETRDSGVFVYVSGSKDHCAFLEKQSKAGKKGGQSRSPKKLVNLKQFRSQTEATPKPRPKPNRNLGNPTEVSCSNSGSISNFPIPSESGVAPPANAAGKNPVGLWMEAYKQKYGVRYELQKKDAGILTGFAAERTREKMVLLFACYLAIDDPFYSSQRHPLSLFFRDLPKISVAAQTGIDPSKPEEPEWKREARAKEEAKRRLENAAG
jgi:hypothetical protein